MADFIQPTSVNSELVSAGLNPNDPANTYVDFAQKLAANRQQQALQEQQIAHAKEIAAQAGIGTQQAQEAQAAGANPLLAGTMTPEQAVASLRIIVKSKGLPITEDMINEWAATLPDRVSTEQVEAFASRFARETSRLTQPGKYTTDMEIPVPAGKTATDLGLQDMHTADGTSIDDKTVSDGTATAHVPADGMYQTSIDNQGMVLQYVLAGKEPADQTAKNESKASDSAEKQWQKLDNTLNTFIRSQRGNMLTSSLVRADRALGELANSEVLSPQVLDYIREDISGIFTGGVPPVSGKEGTSFETVYQSVNRQIQKYTGNPTLLDTDNGKQREYMLGLVSRLRESTLDIIKTMIASEFSAYKKIISDDPDRWDQMQDAKVAVAEAGLTTTGHAAIAANASPSFVQSIPGIKSLKAALTNQQKPTNKVVPKYTVE